MTRRSIIPCFFGGEEGSLCSYENSVGSGNMGDPGCSNEMRACCMRSIERAREEKEEKIYEVNLGISQYSLGYVISRVKAKCENCQEETIVSIPKISWIIRQQGARPGADVDLQSGLGKEIIALAEEELSSIFCSQCDPI